MEKNIPFGNIQSFRYKTHGYPSMYYTETRHNRLTRCANSQHLFLLCYCCWKQLGHPVSQLTHLDNKNKTFSSLNSRFFLFCFFDIYFSKEPKVYKMPCDMVPPCLVSRTIPFFIFHIHVAIGWHAVRDAQIDWDTHSLISKILYMPLMIMTE